MNFSWSADGIQDNCMKNERGLDHDEGFREGELRGEKKFTPRIG